MYLSISRIPIAPVAGMALPKQYSVCAIPSHANHKSTYHLKNSGKTLQPNSFRLWLDSSYESSHVDMPDKN